MGTIFFQMMGEEGGKREGRRERPTHHDRDRTGCLSDIGQVLVLHICTHRRTYARTHTYIHTVACFWCVMYVWCMCGVFGVWCMCDVCGVCVCVVYVWCMYGVCMVYVWCVCVGT